MIERLCRWLRQKGFGAEQRPESRPALAKCPVCGADLDLPGVRQVHEEVLAEFAARPRRPSLTREGGRTL